MPDDLDNLRSQGEREVFDPENAWPDASGRVIVQTQRMAGGLYQVGYDPETGKHWLRTGSSDVVSWGEWITAPDPPAAEEASGEYETRVMTAKRGPGRPRKSEPVD